MIKNKSYTFGTFLSFLLLITSFSNFLPTISAQTTVYLDPIADSYVDTDNPTSNYGGSDYLDTDYWDFTVIDDQSRDSWLMFDLSSIPSGATLTGANLWLYAWYVESPTPTIAAIYCSDNSWSEFGITFLNNPFSSWVTPIADSVVVGIEDTWYSWDLTTPVETTLSANVETLSVTLFVLNSGDLFSASFYSKEGWRNNPYLEVTYTLLESSLTCFLSETSVTYGSSVVFSGILTDASTGASLSGRTVFLQSSQSGISDWETFATVTTGSPYNYTYAPNAGTCQIRATWNGDNNYGGDTSPTVTLEIGKASSDISCIPSVITLTIGSELTFSGSISLSIEDAPVTLSLIKPDTSIIDRTITTNSDGFYTYIFQPDIFGPWSITADWRGNQNYNGASSSSKTFDVTKISSSISCSVSSSEITIEDSITVSGAIDPTHSSKTVTIIYVKPGGSRVTRTVTTEPDGSYSDTYTPDVDGSWDVMASWDGDATHEGASSSYTLFTVLKSGCLIATATYGSELSPQVQFLRGFRDNTVYSTFAGSSFMTAFNGFYYSFSPSVASVISDNSALRDIMKVVLYPLIAILQVSSAAFSVFSFLPELGVITAGLIASSLIGIVYFLPIALIFSLKKRFQVSIKIVRLMGLVLISSVLFLVFAEIVKYPPMMMVFTGAFVLVTIISATLTSLRIVSKRLIH